MNGYICLDTVILIPFYFLTVISLMLMYNTIFQLVLNVLIIYVLIYPKIYY